MISNRVNAINLLTEELFRYTIIASSEIALSEHVNICRVLEETLVSFYVIFEQNSISPEITIPERAVTKSLDENALSRIFGNIISNAIKYGDGDLKVEMSENGEIVFSNKANSLKGSDISRIFDRFYTLDYSKRSTGLGLSIAKSLTEKMNGKIKADYIGESLVITLSFN